MLPINFEGANFVFEKPKGMTDEECSSLAVWKGVLSDGFPRIISAWMPSKEDVEAINAGRPVWLNILGESMPPVLLYTADAEGNVNQ